MGVQQKRDTKQPIEGVQQNETPKSGLGDQGAGMAVLEPNSRRGDRAVSTKCPRYRVVLRRLSILDGGDRPNLAGVSKTSEVRDRFNVPDDEMVRHLHSSKLMVPKF
jgi:hypothetical protein